MEDLRMYILVNKDIKINKGKLAGQVGHAVASYIYNNCGYENIEKLGDLAEFDSYMKQHQKKIILYCSQLKLEELEENYIAIRDKGWTDLEPNTLTCINIGILDYNKDFPEDLKFIRNLKLVR